ncbi:MAG: hypothetical protein GF317_00160 [Candidatus Lokiarchaeota archaeon]|nr:hypothetical protein [Candidatus Lokiarchaeota archaeon]MBD3198396.1 hypothetical protein [Candidatus Lokiarchaeota archaeon]
MYDKILVGMDDSEDAVRAAERAIEIQKKFNSKVIAFHSVLHHLSEISPGYMNSGGSSISLTIHQDYVNRGRRIIKETEELFKENNAEVETRLVFDIPPEDYIEKTVDEEDIDLVILGCQGQHNKLKRTFVGTVPDKVLNDANCDVLVIR